MSYIYTLLIHLLCTYVGRLFLGLTILDPLTNNEPWREINNLPSLISDLPGGAHDPTGIIGIHITILGALRVLTDTQICM